MSHTTLQSRSVTSNQPAMVVYMRPSRGWSALNLRELWRYRELIYLLIWRDIKVRYKQTALGASWAIIQPFVTMVVFSLFFGRLAKIPSDDIPYTFLSLTNYLIPIVAVIAGIAIRGEEPRWNLYAGLVLVLGGIGIERAGNRD